MKNELAYHTCGDYLIPDIKLSYDISPLPWVNMGAYGGNICREMLR